MNDTLIMNKAELEDAKKKTDINKSDKKEASTIPANFETTTYDEEVAELFKSVSESKKITVSSKDIIDIMTNVALLNDTVKKQTALLEDVTSSVVELRGSIDDMSSYYKTNNDYVEKVLHQLSIQDRRCIEILETVNNSAIKVSKLEGVQASIAKATDRLKLGVQDAKSSTNELSKDVNEVKDKLHKVTKDTESNRKDTENLRNSFERKTAEIDTKLSFLDRLKGLFK